MKPTRRRWKQTAEQGYVPNSVLENVFMAAAMDDDMGKIFWETLTFVKYMSR